MEHVPEDYLHVPEDYLYVNGDDEYPSLTNSPPFRPVDPYNLVMFPHIKLSIGILGLIFNSLLLAVIAKPTITKNAHVCIYLITMTVANLLVFFFETISFCFWNLFRSAASLHVLCGLRAFFVDTSDSVYAWIILVLLVDRWIKVMAIRLPASCFRSAAAKFCSHLPAWIMTGIVNGFCTLIFATSVPSMDFSPSYSYSRKCVQQSYQLYLIINMIICQIHLVVALLILCLYCALCCVGRKRIQTSEEPEKDEDEGLKREDDVRLMKLTLVLSGLLVLTRSMYLIFPVYTSINNPSFGVELSIFLFEVKVHV